MRNIKSLPVNIRPRERLLEFGPEILNIDELLAVILITGKKSLPLSKLVKKIATKINSHDIKNELIKLNLGQAKTSQILASIELGRRIFNNSKTIIKSDEQIFGLSYEILSQEKEKVLCLYLNGNHELIKKEIIAVGSLNQANLTPQNIFAPIKNLPISSIILIHNHPSGNLDPSKTDLLFTQRIKLAGDLIGVKLINHYIVSSNGWNKIPF